MLLSDSGQHQISSLDKAQVHARPVSWVTSGKVRDLPASWLLLGGCFSRDLGPFFAHFQLDVGVCGVTHCPLLGTSPNRHPYLLIPECGSAVRGWCPGTGGDVCPSAQQCSERSQVGHPAPGPDSARPPPEDLSQVTSPLCASVLSPGRTGLVPHQPHLTRVKDTQGHFPSCRPGWGLGSVFFGTTVYL